MTRALFFYPGEELALFKLARQWKAYWGAAVRPYIKGAVLECGAGIGGTTEHLCTGQERDWLCLEPDPGMSQELERRIEKGSLPANCRVATCMLPMLDADEQFDTIIYADVLEHIADDKSELSHAAQRLRAGGHLIVLAPAHGFLFSPFDRAIGHYRRYSRGALLKLNPPGMQCCAAFYLDSAGLLASLMNRVLLRADMPTQGQIGLWDSYLIPISRFLDPLFKYSIGKSVVVVWRRPGEKAGL